MSTRGGRASGNGLTSARSLTPGLAWLGGRTAEAYTAIAEAHAGLRRAMDPGMARLVADQLDALTRDIDPASSSR